MFFEINNLNVKTSGKSVLHGVNLTLKKGCVYALLGPNGSGKSSLAQTIAGNPLYRITKGDILLEGKSVSRALPEKRVELGIALAYQNPPMIKGVKMSSLLSMINKDVHEKTAGDILSQKLLSREVNVGFSGGEKKLSELAQIVALKPKLAIFDEIDSGLDIKNMKKLVKRVQQELKIANLTALFITHSGSILELLAPTATFVLLNGQIVCQSNNYQKVMTTIQRYGYERCKKCPLLAN